jgi:hypothetical protein
MARGTLRDVLEKISSNNSFRLHQVLTSLDFTTVIPLQSKVVSLAPNSQPGGPGPHIYIPQEHGGPVITPRHCVPFSFFLRLAGLREDGEYAHIYKTLPNVIINAVNTKCWTCCFVRGPCRIKGKQRLALSRTYFYFPLSQYFLTYTTLTRGARGSAVVKALCCKPEGRGLETR